MMSNFLILFIHNNGNHFHPGGQISVEKPGKILWAPLEKGRKWVKQIVNCTSTSWVEAIPCRSSYLMSWSDFDADCITFQFIFMILLVWFTILSWASKTSDMSANKAWVKHEASILLTLITKRNCQNFWMLKFRWDEERHIISSWYVYDDTASKQKLCVLLRGDEEGKMSFVRANVKPKELLLPTHANASSRSKLKDGI